MRKLFLIAAAAQMCVPAFAAYGGPDAITVTGKVSSTFSIVAAHNGETIALVAAPGSPDTKSLAYQVTHNGPVTITVTPTATADTDWTGVDVYAAGTENGEKPSAAFSLAAGASTTSTFYVVATGTAKSTAAATPTSGAAPTIATATVTITDAS